MKIEFTIDFKFLLGEIITYIATDKPIAARKFKKKFNAFNKERLTIFI
jgi:hypothetical protein